MRVGIIFVYVDFHRKGRHHRGVLQPQIGPLIAALLPADIEIDVINDTWEDPDWTKDYDLLFISSLHSDFDRARQISHYWRRRGAKTVYGGIMASTYSHLCRPFFDAVVVGDPEGCVQQVYKDFCEGTLQPIYTSSVYDATKVPVPRFELSANKQLIPIAIEATRGCPFTCEFCALTGIGTRFHIRPPELVVRDIKEAQSKLRGLVPTYKLYTAVFNDNNIGGNLSHLKRLCEAITPLRMYWGSAITFNALTDPEVVKGLSRAGCRSVFMGLESFNPEAIADMGKYQNAIDQTKRVFDQCRKNGILIISGLMINPLIDDCSYMQTIPNHLEESGLHVPSFICFECPIPGTHHFYRVASEETPAFLPNALLRDFTGYTLVTKPKREPLDVFVDGYKRLMDAAYSRKARLRKLAIELPRLLFEGFSSTALFDILLQKSTVWQPHPDRTYLAGTDVPPPEATNVPLTEDDFESEEERRAIMEPWRVSDAEGRVLPEWRMSTKVFEPQGRISASAQELML
jgi:radical SAM family protein